ncbi:MAG: hypothetical protein PHD10_03265 [Bacilli bacterium]|nr:hypothetical protein [Bacilli bacterium]
MNNNINYFNSQKEELNKKRNQLDENLASGLLTEIQHNDLLNKLKGEEENLYRSYLNIAKETIKRNLNITFSSYKDTKGYSMAFKKINTLESKSIKELVSDINEIKSIYQTSNIDNEEVLIAIKILEEYYISNNE